MIKPALVFFATANFAKPILETLVKDGYPIALVITKEDQPRGRGQKLLPTPIKQLAQELHLTVAQPTSTTDLKNILSNFETSVGIVVAYGKILTQDIIDLFPRGLINLHPSLLPKYRGPSPIQTTLLQGETITGTTVMLLDEKTDHGPILAQAELEITETDNTASLESKLANLSAELLIKTLPQYLNNELLPRPQVEEQATYCQKIETSQTEINWQQARQSCLNQIRAFSPQPGAWTTYNGLRLKILKARAVSQANPSQLTFASADGLLEALEVQPANKKVMSGHDFLLGQKNK